MRKCPNCKKPVPVGARRCVYCRAMLSEAPAETEGMDSTTRLGFGGNGRNSDTINGTTSFGRPSSIPDDEPQNPMSRRSYDNSNPHHTMLGLGPITSGSSGGSSPVPSGMNQRTIAGMPGISFDPNQVKHNSSPHQTPARNSGYSSSASASRRSSDEYNDPLHPIGSSRENMHSVQNSGRMQSQPGRSASSSQSMRSVPSQSSQRRTPISLQATPAANSAAVAQPKPAPAKTTQNEDPLAGLAGVAPMPSSLVDEEFVDLTSKLFGDDFAAISSGSEEDEEDDGLDFDTPAIPAPAPKPAEVKAVTVQAATTMPQPKAAPSDQQTTPNTSSKSPAHKAKKGSGVSDFIVMGTAAISALLALIWFITAASNLAACPILAGGAFVCIAISILYFLLKKKLSSLVLAILFFVGAILLFATIHLSSDVKEISVSPLPIAIVSQLISAITCFLKKA